MSPRSKTLLTAAAIAVAVAGLLPATESQTVYRVGGDLAWDINVDYKAWADGKAFKVGDTLEFMYPQGVHNIVVGDWRSYEACILPSNYFPWLVGGDDKGTLGAAGWFYFMSLEKLDCQRGMKLAILAT